MTNAILQQVEAYYNARVERHGATPAGVDWNGADSQRLRFAQLRRLLPETGPFSLLDYGCGYGALWGWLQEQGVACDYRGCDLAPLMIETARNSYGEGPQRRFALSADELGPADFCVASGIFNVKQDRSTEEWEAYVLETIARLNQLSTKGFAFNLLTSYSDPDRMRGHLYYGDPCVLFDHCKRRYARNVSLLHDYGLYEFTILVRKDSGK